MLPFPSKLGDPARITGMRSADASTGEEQPAPHAEGVFRRFFDLIGRFERPGRRLETKSVPPRRVRITRLDRQTLRIP